MDENKAQATRLDLAYHEIGTIHTFLVQTAYLLQYERDCLNNAVSAKMAAELSKEIGDQIARKNSVSSFRLSPQRVLKIKQCVRDLKEMIQNEKLRSMQRSLTFLDVLQKKSKIVDEILKQKGRK